MSPLAGGEPSGAQRTSSGACLTREAFAARFETTHDRLWCIAAAVLADRSQADDILQEAALIALSKLEQFDPETNFAAWMGQIVRYTAMNEVRRRTRRSTTSVQPATLDAATESHETRSVPLPVSRSGEITGDTGAFDDALLRALRTLEDTARASLLLRTVLGLTYREIAATLSIPEGTAMSHVHRSRGALRRTLSEPHAPGTRPIRSEATS